MRTWLARLVMDLLSYRNLSSAAPLHDRRNTRLCLVTRARSGTRRFVNAVRRLRTFLSSDIGEQEPDVARRRRSAQCIVARHFRPGFLKLVVVSPCIGGERCDCIDDEPPSNKAKNGER